MRYECGYNKKHLVSYSIGSFLIVFMLSFSVLFFIEKEVRKAKIEELENHELNVVKLENAYIGREFNLLLADIHYLHHAFQEDLFTNDYTKVIANWIEFSTHRQIYDQIRFIDVNGNEKIRINLGTDGGYSVPEKNLQNKKDRYYFTETIPLREESVYVSPLDLNIEGGEIEVPYKPMIRLSTPIFDEQGTLEGIIVLNYLADQMLSGFRELARNSLGEVILLNSDGYRLSSSDSTLDWHFMFDDKKEDTFEKEYPNEWKAILKNGGKIVTDKALITATPVVLSDKYQLHEVSNFNPSTRLGDGSWYIVSVIERTDENREFFSDNLFSMLVDVFVKNILYYLLIALCSIFVGILIYIKRKSYSKIKFYSEYDSLTKTFNRRAGIAKLNNLTPADERRHFSISLCFLDINGLKVVNDTLGHKLGDELIISVAEVINATIREKDFLIRLGGDEFLIVFDGIDKDMAEVVWQRIVKSYETINLEDNRAYTISVSHGIVDFNNKQKTHVDDLINAADEIMYHEKLATKVNLNVIKSLDA